VREAPENIALTKNITTAIIIGTDGLSRLGRGPLRAAIATVLADASDMIPATDAVQVWTPELVLALDIGCQRNRTVQADTVKAPAAAAGTWTPAPSTSSVAVIRGGPQRLHPPTSPGL